MRFDWSGWAGGVYSAAETVAKPWIKDLVNGAIAGIVEDVLEDTVPSVANSLLVNSNARMAIQPNWINDWEVADVGIYGATNFMTIATKGFMYTSERLPIKEPNRSIPMMPDVVLQAPVQGIQMMISAWTIDSFFDSVTALTPVNFLFKGENIGLTSDIFEQLVPGTVEAYGPGANMNIYVSVERMYDTVIEDTNSLLGASVDFIAKLEIETSANSGVFETFAEIELGETALKFGVELNNNSLKMVADDIKVNSAKIKVELFGKLKNGSLSAGAPFFLNNVLLP